MVIGSRPEARAGGSEDMGIIVRTLFPRVFLQPFRRLAFLDIEQFYLVLNLLVRRSEPCVFHAERVQDGLFQIFFPFHAGNRFHDSSTDVNAGVGIERLGARFEHDR